MFFIPACSPEKRSSTISQRWEANPVQPCMRYPTTSSPGCVPCKINNHTSNATPRAQAGPGPREQVFAEPAAAPGRTQLRELVCLGCS